SPSCVARMTGKASSKGQRVRPSYKPPSISRRLTVRRSKPVASLSPLIVSPGLVVFFIIGVEQTFSDLNHDRFDGWPPDLFSFMRKDPCLFGWTTYVFGWFSLVSTIVEIGRQITARRPNRRSRCFRAARNRWAGGVGQRPSDRSVSSYVMV